MKRAILGVLLVMGFASCGGSPAALLSLSASGPVELYSVRLWDASGRILLDTGFVALPSGVDLQTKPYTIDVRVPRVGEYTVAIIGVAGPAPDRFGRLVPGSTGYFYAERFRATRITRLSAQLMVVPSQHIAERCLGLPATDSEKVGDDDCDGDLWPDMDTWLQRLPDAAQLYRNKRDLLDCNDKSTQGSTGGTTTRLNPFLTHPFATELCNDGIDEACDGLGDDRCQDTDGDSDPDGQDCAEGDLSRHHSTAKDPYPESPNCCGYSLGKSGAEANQDFSNDPLCHVRTCNDGIDQDCSGGTDARCIVDSDCDGASDDEDCDDTDPRISPRAIERCDTIADDNCNGRANEICVPCDLDGDGYLRSDAANGCAPTAGEVDCVDTDSGISPGTTQVPVPKLPAGFERCDGTANAAVACARREICLNVNPGGTRQDADCNGLANRICPPVPPAPGAACDADRDGFAPANMLNNSTCQAFIKGTLPDCDDSDPRIFPNAPEICGDGIAQSCLADVPCTSDLDGDGYNDDVDCDSRPGLGVSVHPWAVELCNGIDDDCDGLIDEGNPDDQGQPLAQSGQVQGCTDSNVGTCGTNRGMCVCSGVPVNTQVIVQTNRVRCPGGSATIDARDAANTVSAPKCYGAGQPSPELCDGLDNDCDAAPTAADDGSDMCPQTPLPTCCASVPSNPGCTNTQGDVNNCGGCNNVCRLPNAAMQNCTSGVCAVVTCNASFVNCNAATATDGCECNTATSQCVGTLPGATCLLNNDQNCTSGSQCVFAGCCGGRCTDPQSDNSNCGSCGNSCVGKNGGVCIGGNCGCRNLSDCNSQISNQCNGNVCQCSGITACNPTTQRCVSSGCRLLSGQACTAPTDCASGICTNFLCG